MSECQSSDNWSENSTCGVTSAASYSSYIEERDNLRAILYHIVAENERVDDALVTQHLILEEEALQERLQMEMEILRAETK